MTITHTFQSAKSDGADTTVVQPSDWNAAHTVAEGYALLRVASVELTNAQIKALPTTPVEIIAAQGEDKVVFPMFAILYFNRTADYTNISASSAIQIANGGSAIMFDAHEDPNGLVSGILAPGIPQGSLSFSSSGFGLYFNGISWNPEMYVGLNNSAANSALNIQAVNGDGDFTGGNAANTLKIIVYYMVADL